MRELLARIRVYLIFGVLLVACAVSMLIDRSALRERGGRDYSRWSGALLEFAAPVERLLTAPVDFALGLWDRYVALVDVKHENEALHHEVARLREEALQLREALVASGRLQQIAEMRTAFEFPMLPAEVVGQDASPWFRSILINRGRRQGVRAGMPVINEEGVVGLVSATSPRAAQVLLLLERQSAIDAIVQRSRSRGIVRGLGTGALGFEFVVRGGDVRVGDVVITSGRGGVYPKGLRIAEVSEVPEPGASLLQTAQLKPAVDFGRLEQAFVLLWRSPTMELIYAEEVGTVSEDGVGRSTTP